MLDSLVSCVWAFIITPLILLAVWPGILKEHGFLPRVLYCWKILCKKAWQFFRKRPRCDTDGSDEEQVLRIYLGCYYQHSLPDSSAQPTQNLLELLDSEMQCALEVSYLYLIYSSAAYSQQVYISI